MVSKAQRTMWKAERPEPAAMDLTKWVDMSAVEAVLDVGCNVGELLSSVRAVSASVRLAGIEINLAALEAARARLPEADLRHCSATSLPFPDAHFDCVTCIEVLEHVPPSLRRQVLVEVNRVLRPSGLLVLQVPHAGMFAWLDPNNLRFRFPRLYTLSLGRGRRDSGFKDTNEGVVWHHHFGMRELEELSEGLFAIDRVRRGGLFMLPMSDIARWPFYRLGRCEGPVFAALTRAAVWDLDHDYGPYSYDVRCLLRKVS